MNYKTLKKDSNEIMSIENEDNGEVLSIGSLVLGKYRYDGVIGRLVSIFEYTTLPGHFSIKIENYKDGRRYDFPLRKVTKLKSRRKGEAMLLSRDLVAALKMFKPDKEVR